MKQEHDRKMFFSSLTRISDLETEPFDILPVARSAWRDGDYVVCAVPEHPPGFDLIELANGRMVEVEKRDLVVGALGTRQATLEAVGSWRDVRDENDLQALTSAGLFGRATSVSLTLPSLLPLSYEGHVARDGETLSMSDFVSGPEETAYRVPTILLIGTSMASGKTTVGKVVIRELKRLGLRVVGSKLSGAGRYRDVLGMGDAGADAIYDFVDVGLPSSICPESEFRPRLRQLLAKITAEEPDVAVVEAGASPLEPYNGQAVIDEIRDQVRCTFLCASDPYAVLGVLEGFGIPADVVSGLATSTSAGRDLIRSLSGLPALNIKDPECLPELRKILSWAQEL